MVPWIHESSGQWVDASSSPVVPGGWNPMQEAPWKLGQELSAQSPDKQTQRRKSKIITFGYRPERVGGMTREMYGRWRLSRLPSYPLS